MTPEARALFKRLLWRARALPDAAYAARMRERLRAAFRAAPQPGDAAAHAAALARGEHVARELDALLRLHKYRALQGRYGNGH
jgi:hypothetical protein